MWLPIFFYLSLMQILLSQSKDDNWEVKVSKTINAKKGSNITILCTFKTPPEREKENFEVYWKTKGMSNCSKNDRENNAFAFHPDSSCVHPKFRSRTHLIGDERKRNCSLQIFNISGDEPTIYVRVIGENDGYTYIKYPVSFNLDGNNSDFLRPTHSTFAIATTNFPPDLNDSEKSTQLYLAILLPILGLLIVAAAGTVAWKIHKRSHTFKQQDSGYYVNFKRTSSTPPKSEPFCEPPNEMAPDPKVIEPVYINFQTSARPTDQQVETVDNVYANVNYLT